MTGPHPGIATIVDAPWRALYPADLPVDRDVPESALDMLGSAVARDPEAAAVRYFDGALRYGEVDDLSDRLAQHWRGAGIAAGDRVAIILQNVPQVLIAAAAAWKLGAIPVTINPMYRGGELQKLFGDCRPGAILCHDDNRDVDAAVATSGPVRSLLTTSPYDFQSRDDARVLPARAEQDGGGERDLMTTLRETGLSASPAHRALPNDVALILYTSGTTGVPKGAMLTHRNLASNAAFCRDWFGLDAGSRIFGIAPLFHITGFVCHLCAALCVGASVAMTYRFAPAVALDAFREHRPTFTIGAITAFIALMQAPDAAREDFASFTAIFSGGAPVPPAVVEAFAARFGKDIRNCYGMTETAAPAIFSPPTGAIPVDRESGALAIGIPIPGSDAKIVDEGRRPLAVGEVGELVLRGPAVMKGYWRKPVETAEVLVDGWMHTGDIAYRDGEGWFYLIDRKKDMIVASGFKVWPREVEDMLYTHPAVREAAVVGVPDAYRGETVKAFVSVVAGAQATPAELIGYCRDRLATYKVPRAIEILGELPKTVSGKIIRAELRTPTTRKEPT